MRAITCAASLLRGAAGSAPTSAALHHPTPAGGPCLFKAFWNHSVAGDEKASFLTLHDHNTAIHNLKMKNEKELNDLNNKFKKSLLEQKISMDMAMLQLKCDMRKDEDDMHNKRYLNHLAAKNELKILQEKFELHKLNISHMTAPGTITRLKNYFGGILTKFTNIPKILFKPNEKE